MQTICTKKKFIHRKIFTPSPPSPVISNGPSLNQVSANQNSFAVIHLTGLSNRKYNTRGIFILSCNFCGIQNNTDNQRANDFSFYDPRNSAQCIFRLQKQVRAPVGISGCEPPQSNSYSRLHWNRSSHVCILSC